MYNAQSTAGQVALAATPVSSTSRGMSISEAHEIIQKELALLKESTCQLVSRVSPACAPAAPQPAIGEGKEPAEFSDLTRALLRVARQIGEVSQELRNTHERCAL